MGLVGGRQLRPNRDARLSWFSFLGVLGPAGDEEVAVAVAALTNPRTLVHPHLGFGILQRGLYQIPRAPALGAGRVQGAQLRADPERC